MSSFPAVALAVTLGLAAAPTAFAQQQKLLPPPQSEITFTSHQMGVPVDGRFKTFSAQVAFDPKKPETAKIAFTVDLASISMGAAESEAELVKQPWFDTKKFPQASFQSTSVKPTGPGRFDVAGQLSIKGKPQPVVVPVQLAQNGATTTATGGFTLKRLDFKIGEGEWADTSMVANEVQVKFKLALSGVAPL
jgi:polyisoprenoid-binding protein YceI